MSKQEEIDPRAKYVAMIYLAMFADKRTRFAAVKMAKHNRQKHGAAVWGAALEQATSDLSAAAEVAGRLVFKTASVGMSSLAPIHIGGQDFYPMSAA